MNKYLRAPSVADLRYLSENLRDADKREIEASSGLDPLSALVVSSSVSDHMKVIEFTQGKPCAIFGVTQRTPVVSSIWMVATDGLSENPLKFLRHSKSVIRSLFDLTGSQVFYNYTHTPNELHHKWLRWCGARLGDVVLRGPSSNEPFYPFVIHRKDYVR